MSERDETREAVEVQLTQGMVALVDRVSLPLIAEFKWFAQKCRGKARATARVRQRGSIERVYMHRVVTQATEDQGVIHLDGNQLNNQLSNLRVLPRLEAERSCAKRPIRIDGDVAYVPLSLGLEAMIDASDAEHIGQYNWHLNGKGYPARCRPKEMWRAHGKFIQLHREIMGGRDGYVVDHINRNPLDARRSNRRWATLSQNGCNNSRAAGASGYRGVRREGNRWVAMLKFEGKMYRRGPFERPEDAYRSYRAMAKEIHGEFASF